MVDTRSNFRFVEVVNHDDRENYAKLVLKKVIALPVDREDNPTERPSRVEQMRKNFEPSSNGFSYLRPSLFTPKPFSSSTSNLHNTNHNSNILNNNNSFQYNHHQMNSNDPIYENKPVPRPVVPPKPRYKKPPPLPLIDNDRPKCASPVPELPETPQQQLLNNNNNNIKNLHQSRNQHLYTQLDNHNNSSFHQLNHNQPILQNHNGTNSESGCTQDTHCNGNNSFISPNMKNSPQSNNKNNQSVTRSPQYKELFEQKSQIRERLFSKIEVLREEERELANEKVEIDFLTRRFYVRLLDKNESDADKFSQFIQEIQQITKLKSGLILRLDKLEQGGHLKYTPEEIMKKRAQLQGQILEAENLQKNTDRRRKVQERTIQNHFTNQDFIDFQNMIDNLIRIVRDQREMEHKITMGNEKLRALDDIG